MNYHIYVFFCIFWGYYVGGKASDSYSVQLVSSSIDTVVHHGVFRLSPKLDRNSNKWRWIIISTCSKLSENVIKNFSNFYWWDPLFRTDLCKSQFQKKRIVPLDELSKMIYSEVFISIDKYLFRHDTLYSTCQSSLYYVLIVI